MSDRAQRAAKNIVVSIATQLIGWSLTFAVTLFLPRYAGSVGLGEMAAAGAFVSLFGVVVPLGTSSVLTKMVARNANRTGELLATAIFLRTPLALLVGGLTIVMSHFARYSHLGRNLIVIYAVAMVIGDASDVLSAVLQGQEKIARQSTNALIGKIVSAGLTITLILMHRSLTEIAAVGLITTILALMLNASLFRSEVSRFQLPERRAIVDLARSGLPFLGYGFFQTLYGQTDPLVLKFVANSAAVGWYAASFRLIGTTLFFPSAIASALLPSLSQLFGENRVEEFQALARRLLELCLLMATPVFILFLSIPRELIRLFHYPASFSGSIPVLPVAGAGCLLYYVAIALGTAVVASDGQAKMFRASIVAAIIGIPACFAASWLTGHVSSPLWGGQNAAVGAMASDVFLETILITFYVTACPPGTYNRSTLLYIGRICIAATPMALMLLVPFANHNGLWKLAPAITLYIAACFMLRCIEPSYFALAKRLLSRGR